MRHSQIVALSLVLAGCFDPVNELLDTAATAGSGTNASSGAASGATGSSGAASGSASGIGSGAASGGASGTSGSSSGSTSGAPDAGPVVNFCMELETELVTLGPLLTMCGQAVNITQQECITQISTCSPAELASLDTFLACVDMVSLSSCSSLIPILTCYQGISSVGCFNIAGGASSSSGGTVAGTVGAGTTGGGFGTGGTSGVGFGTGSSGGMFDGGGPPVVPYCAPCTRSRECGPPNACILDGQNQQVCGQSCGAGQTCPTGSTCQMTHDVRMNAVTECVPTSCGSTLDAG